MRNYLIFAGFIFCANTAPVSAQHSNDPKRIFKDNYAGEILGKSVPKDDKPNKKSGAKNSGQGGTANKKDFGFVEPEKPAEEKVIAEDMSYENQSGSKVVWVGAVLNSNDTDHLVEKLQELAEQAIKHDLMIGPVFLVGNTDIETALPYFTKLQKRQGKITYVKEIPSKYKAIKKSPAWIVQTPKGQILLEALGPLRRNFNKNSELVLPEQP